MDDSRAALKHKLSLNEERKIIYQMWNPQYVLFHVFYVIPFSDNDVFYYIISVIVLLQQIRLS